MAIREYGLKSLINGIALIPDNSDTAAISNNKKRIQQTDLTNKHLAVVAT